MRAWLWATVALASFGGEARAYVLDAPTLFHRFAQRAADERVRGGALEGRAVLSRPDRGAPQDLPARLELAFPRGCRLELDLPGGPVTVESPEGMTARQGGNLAAAGALATLGCPLIALKGTSAREAEAAMTRFAARLGVDVATVSLSRLGGKAAYVVGARPRDLQRAQIWFDQRSLLPVRVVGHFGGELWDVRFEDPASLATGGTAPRRIAVFRAGQEVLGLTLMTPRPTESPAPAATGGDDEHD